MKFKVAIPSYNRAEHISELTINTLLTKNIKPKQIDIFVANDEEYVKYKNQLSETLYNEIIVGEKGKQNQLNFIREFYSKKQRLLNLDDDISTIKYVRNGKLEDLKDLNSYSNMIFKYLNKSKTGLCGTYYPRNPFFMKHRLDLNFYHCEGGMYWTINNPSPKLHTFLKTCEDLEFSLKNYEYYGKVMRTCEVCFFDATLYGNHSNLKKGYDDNYQVPYREKLIRKYPHLIRWYMKNGNYFIKPIKQPNHERIILREREL